MCVIEISENLQLVCEGTRLLEEGEVQPDPPFEKNTVLAFYNTVTRNIISSAELIVPPPSKLTEKPHVHSPLLIMYLGVATALQYMKKHYRVAKDDYYHKCPTDIQVCKENGLAVVLHAKICDMNVEELITSFSAIELQYSRPLVWTEDLEKYIDALELRLSDILLHVYDESVHNIAPYAFKCGEGQYTCNAPCEFLLISQITSVRIELLGALHTLRETARYVDDANPCVAVLCKNIFEMMLSTCKNAYGDFIRNHFKAVYYEENVGISELLMYVLDHGIGTRVDAQMIIGKMRSTSQWRAITERCARPLSDIMEFQHEDFLGWKLLFHIIMDLLLQRFLKIKWLPFAMKGVCVAKMTESEFHNLTLQSTNSPIFIESFNEACVFSQGILHIFGTSKEDYLRAIFFWIEIIRSVHDNKVLYMDNYVDMSDFITGVFGSPYIDSLIVAERADPVYDYGSDNSDIIDNDGADVVQKELTSETVLPLPNAVTSSSFALKMYEKYVHEKEMLRTICDTLDLTKRNSTKHMTALGDSNNTGFVQSSYSGW